jgi:hypothetical protein
VWPLPLFPYGERGQAKARFCPIGRYLVGPSDSLCFAPQSDSEKKENAIRKSSARNDQIQGLFGSPP